MKLHISSELKTTPERAWALYFDPQFNQELREVLKVSSLDEQLYEETSDVIRMVYKVTVVRTLPDWVRKVTGDIKVAYTAHDVFDKKNFTMDSKMIPEYMPNKISGRGRWSVRQVRPGWVRKEYDGELNINIPVVGKKMEERLAAAIEADFELSNELLSKWVKRDHEALAAGLPLPALSPPAPMKKA